MSEQSKTQKTRRRFLADMLFMGGGVTAAAILAKSQMLEPGETGPTAVGEMVMPDHLKETDCETPLPQVGGEPVQPQPEVQGRYVAPESEAPNPNGGSRAPRK